MNSKTTKTSFFALLIMSIAVPFGMMGQQVEATDNYDEEKALQRVIELDQLAMQKLEERANLEELRKDPSSDQISIDTAIDKINSEIAAYTEEFEELQAKNKEKYYIEPTKYQRLVDVSNIVYERYMKNHTDELIVSSVSVDHLSKGLTVGVSKDVFNTIGYDTVVDSLSQVIPSDITWSVIEEPEAMNYSCSSRTSCTNPIIGGIQIEIDNNGNCTLGFEATLDSVTGFVTAGHCGSTISDDVYHPGDGNLIGNVTATEYYDDSFCDCTFVQTSVSIANDIYVTSSTTYAPTTTTVNANQSGEWLKVSGQKTDDIKYGTVNSTWVTKTVDGITIIGMVGSDVYAQPGDSGAPVTSAFSPTTSLYGTIKGGDGSQTWHIPINFIESYLDIDPILD